MTVSFAATNTQSASSRARASGLTNPQVLTVVRGLGMRATRACPNERFRCHRDMHALVRAMPRLFAESIALRLDLNPF